MSFVVSTAAIYFISCHAGPADHFATFADDLVKKGYNVQIYATEPAFKKFQDRQMEAISFSLGNISEEDAAIALAKKCAKANVIITDVGHVFDIALQKMLQIHAPSAFRFAYYDNPEAYVPGGYSLTAAKVMQAAQGVLFANANLVRTPIYQSPSEEVFLTFEKRIGIGYYPLNQAKKMRERREVDHDRIRCQLFSKYFLTDQGQTVLVYAGGNNDEYFSKAMPSFLQFLEEASRKQDLSHIVIVLQQHPGAKVKNLDAILVQQWLERHSQEAGIPRFVISEMNSEDSQVVADGMLYYQTSMGPQFVLAGIPTIQVGHNTYEDVLVRNGLCSTATNADELTVALVGLKEKIRVDPEVIWQGLGLHSDWAARLELQINRYSSR